MIAIDTNLLVYADRSDLPQHEPARALLEALSSGSEPCAIPVFCAIEYVRVVTHPRLFAHPTALSDALSNTEALLESPSFTLLLPGERFAELFARSARDGEARGNLVFDAAIAALCLEHRVAELWTADRDFSRFPGLRVRNPLAEAR